MQGLLRKYYAIHDVHCVTLHRLQYEMKSYKTAEKGCFVGNNCHMPSASGQTSQKVADLLG